MRILYVTNMFPDKKLPYYGIFVKEQIEAIKKYYSIDYDIYYIDGRQHKWNYIKSIFEIHNILSEKQYDLIHVHYCLAGLFLLINIKRKIPVVVTLHGGDILKTQKKYIQIFFSKKILKKADFAITMNNKMDAEVRKYIEKTEIIPCSINTDFFTPPINRKINNPPIVVFPSKKNRVEKNFSLFKNVVNLYELKYSTELQIIELDKMSRQQVVELFQMADVMLMTSYSEGSPQVVKEAMACNLPVVSTNVGDVSYLLENVKRSYVVDTFKVDPLSEALLLSLYTDSSGIDGRDKLIKLGLNDEAIAKRIYNIYRLLLK
jgi:Glycosyltransferase